ncbi:MAG: heme ABC exporter ATP-binding protein CcmA [Acetobacteraceae bacterium]|nr:heme ABC exporter ATP-binding protein CcmA [Acetobacteraceae bacterium]
MLNAMDVAAFRGERLVFEAVSFSVPAGGALLLSGPNGSGKSTLLRILAGLKAPDAGTVSWNGAGAFDDRIAHARRVTYVGHQDAIKLGLTLAENLRFGVGDQCIGAALEAMNLAPLSELPARMLSAGQRRRLALARLALSRAPLWLLDEPTVGLDAGSVDRLGSLFSRHTDRGGVIVAATHLPLPLAGPAELRLR